MVLIALLWIPVIQGARGLYEYLQGIQAYLAPPIAAVFFLGVFIKRLNAAGCLAALVAGFALGLFRLAVDTPVTLGVAGYERAIRRGSLLWIVNNIYFQYYSLLIFLVSVAAMIGVSLRHRAAAGTAAGRAHLRHGQRANSAPRRGAAGTGGRLRRRPSCSCSSPTTYVYFSG